MAYILSAFAGAGAQFFDDNGTPLTGGLVYTYSAGTTTPATTYTDSTGANAHSNPIVLDAAGRTPSEIWVDGGLVYKFIVKTSTDTLVGTYDNIPGIDDPTVFNNLISVTGTNTLLGTATPPINGYVAGATYSFVVPNNNTGAVTISIDGLGAKEITYAGSTPLLANMLVANAIVTIEYDGTRFQLMQSSASIAIVSSLTVSNNATIGGTLAVTGATTITSPSFSVGGNNISAVNSLGFRNRIINGDMRIDQRNAGASVTPTADNTYTVDRFQTRLTQASKYSVQQNAGAVTPPSGFKNYLGVTSLSAYSVAAGDYFGIQQSIEGFNAADFGWGATGAQSVTLSFWVRSSLTGTFGGCVGNAGFNRSYPFTYTISVANTWEQKTVTIAGDTAGTWATGNTTGIALYFGIGAGSTYSGTAGAWAGAGYISATGATSVVGTNGATFYITGVQLEAGTVATPFERRPYGTELALCQRYCPAWSVASGSFAIGVGQAQSTTSASIPLPYPVPPRTAATGVTITGTTGCTNSVGAVQLNTTLAFGNASFSSLALTATTSGLTAGNATILASSSSAVLIIGNGCEL